MVIVSSPQMRKCWHGEWRHLQTQSPALAALAALALPFQYSTTLGEKGWEVRLPGNTGWSGWWRMLGRESGYPSVFGRLRWGRERESRSVVSDSLRPHGLYSP